MKQREEIIDELFRIKAKQAEKVWEYNGMLLGYPDCCIKSFCTQLPSERTLYQKATTIEGFIPCIEHAKQIVSGKITTKDIIKNRLPSFAPFPNE